MDRLTGKVALVTGGGQGIGRGIARRFVREGASVVVAEIDEEAGQKVAAQLGELGGEGLFVPCDVSVKEQIVGAVEQTVERFGRLDVLVNNAIPMPSPHLLEAKTDEDLEEMLGAGLWATWWAMRAAFPTMKRQRGGRVINLYSIDSEAGAWLHADYNMSKDAIRALTRTAAVEWGRHGILVNAIAPAAKGTVYEALAEGVEGFEETAEQMIPLGRVGDPEEDIAPVAAFLASEDARYVTGETIHVDGGLHIPRYNSKPPDLPAD